VPGGLLYGEKTGTIDTSQPLDDSPDFEDAEQIFIQQTYLQMPLEVVWRKCFKRIEIDRSSLAWRSVLLVLYLQFVKHHLTAL
jgi:hypothetical protein